MEDAVVLTAGGGFPPVPPEALRWRVTLNRDERAFLSSGIQGVADFECLLVRCLGRGLSGRVLDFGAGCGRLARWLSGRAAISEVICCDTDAEAVEWCGANLPSVRAIQCDPDDPCGALADSSADIVICASVFTHLDLPRQRILLDGFRRILPVGGCLALSTMGNAYAEKLDARSSSIYSRDGFCYIDDKFWADTFPAWYGTACHSPAFVRTLLADHGFDAMGVYPSALDGAQDIAVAVRSE